MEKMPLITVIVPSYNSPDLYLTLQSILEQDYPRIQLIVIDDSSKLFSRKNVEEFLNYKNKGNIKYIQIFENQKNLGTVVTMNTALRNAQGEYIFNLASDDCFFDNRVLTDWTRAFIKTGAQVMTAYRAVYDEQLCTCLKIEPTSEQVARIQKKTPEELFEDIAGTNFIFGCCTARSAQCVKKYGLFDERYHLIEDHPMNLKLLRMGEKIFFFDRIVVKYRSGGVSSPINYNTVYQEDVNAIFKYDVLPYTKYPIRMRRKNFLWQYDQRILQKRAQLLWKYREWGCMKRMINIWYYAHHPYRIACRILNRKEKGRGI